MTKGMFQSCEHDHHFAGDRNETLMRDELRFAAPLRMFGTIAERLVLKNYLRHFLIERNAQIKTVAESDAWRSFVPEAG